MKKIVLIISINLFLISCNEKETNINTQNETRKYSSILKTEKFDYTGQLSYIEMDENFDVNAVNEKFNVDDILKNEAETWVSFDNQFNSNLNSFESQYLSYLILAKKDLIGLYKYEKSELLKEKLIFHTTNLINHKYAGYSVLYNSLNSLKETNSDYVKSNAAKIVEYSKTEKYHSELISDSDFEKDPVTAKYHKKVKDDLSYLAKIESLK